MIHGLVDRPLTFTVDDLKRLPSVTRLHFIECAGNRASRLARTVQETHGMTSNAEWTGVLLSTLLKECGVKGSAKWFVAEGAEEVKGASSMPVAKAMDDCMIAYGMNGEAVRPQNGPGSTRTDLCPGTNCWPVPTGSGRPFSSRMPTAPA